MASNVKEIYEQLKHIKEYLTKLGPSRRTRVIQETKFNEAKCLYDKFCGLSRSVEEKIKNKEIKDSDIQFFQKIFDNINSVYFKISELCSCSTEIYQKSMTSTMEKFELKTAISLLPIMTGEESITKQLISNIEMYESMIDESSKLQLINFVLKSRLSESAKLRMSPNYSSVTDLLRDMRNILLPKKSDTAIQSQLQRIRQHNLSIEEYGKEIEQLFVDLTISQARGDDNAYKILRPINERIAIKKFSDGLRNARLSTIIAARNYSTLKDTIQGALDENLSSGSEERLMTYNHSRGRPNFPRKRFQRATYHNNSHNFYKNDSYSQTTNNQGYSRDNRGASRTFNNNFRVRNNYRNASRFRGHTGFHGHTRQNQVNIAEISNCARNTPPNDNSRPENQEMNKSDSNWFFRA